MNPGIALADVIAGKDAAVAILGALVARQYTGRGRRVAVSVADITAAVLHERTAKCAGYGSRRRPVGQY